MKNTRPRFIRRPPGSTSARKGVTILIVLALISITLSVSYMMMRTQVTARQIQSNTSRKLSGRNAAQAGITVALRKLHEPDWAGADSSFSGRLSDTDWYEVTYTTGDASLAPGDADDSLYPYRLTLTSTGYAAEAGNLDNHLMHTIEVIVQLVPKRLSGGGEAWERLQRFTIYQWADEDVHVDVPVRTEGPVLLQGKVRLCEDYPPKARPFDGLIDEVALFDRALSAPEIESIYRIATRKEGDGRNEHGDPPSPGGGLRRAYMSADPIHWWPMNELPGGEHAADVAGGRDGTYQGATPGATGFPFGHGNTAARFDGQFGHIDVGPIDVIANQMTILAWFKADSLDSPGARIISKANGTSTDRHHWMLSTTKSSGKYRLRFRMRTNGSTKTLKAGSGDLEPGRWTFAAAVYNGSLMKLYKDGDEVGSTSKSGAIDAAPEIPVWIGDNPPGSPRVHYLRGLEAMRAADEGDCRPFSGPVYFPFSRTTESTRALFDDELKVATHNIPVSNTAPARHPGEVSHYQLYPGGKVYAVTELNSSLRDCVIMPDRDNNPLGIYSHFGKLDIYDNVKIQGTIITNQGVGQPDLDIHGTDVQLFPVDLPPLDGTNTPIRLPTAIVKEDFRVREEASGSLGGLVIAWDDFEFVKGDEAAAFDLKGRLLCRALKLRGRSNWEELNESWWQERLHEFTRQMDRDGAVRFFPEWLAAYHLVAEPLLTIRPDSSPVAYHWHNWDEPIFAAHPDDGVLRWDLVDWIDYAD